MKTAILRNICRLCVISVILYGLVEVLAWIGFIQPEPKQASAQNQTTTERAPIASLFRGDTCAPPCFLGITPGVSTSQDVESQLRLLIEARVLGADLSQISPNTRFPFFWPYLTWETGRIFTNNNIVIEEDIVISIDVLMNRPVSLEEVLETFSWPSTAFATSDFYDANLALAYYDLGIIVNLDVSIEDCTLSSLLDMAVSSLEYYPTQTIMDNLDFYIGNYNFLPPELLEEWTHSRETILCTDAFRELSKATREGLSEEEVDATPQPTCAKAYLEIPSS